MKEKQILSYLEPRNIFPTYISVFPSRRRGTLSCKIHIPLVVSTLVQEDKFWPKFVSCKPWQPKTNLTQDGKLSTYIVRIMAQAISVRISYRNRRHRIKRNGRNINNLISVRHNNLIETTGRSKPRALPRFGPGLA